MNPSNAISPDVEFSLGRAFLARQIAHCFTYPVPGLREGIIATLTELVAEPEESLGGEHACLQAARGAWEESDSVDLETHYTALFMGTSPCPLHETAYGDGRRTAGQPVELADINGFYAAFGFEISAENPTMPDHLAAELEFYSLLLIKAGYAEIQGWSEQAGISTAAVRAFLEYHLGRWVHAFATKLTEAGGHSPFAESAALLVAFVEAECARLEVTPSLATSLCPRDAIVDDDFICPMAADCSQAKLDCGASPQ